jgi:hypothetical protein
MLEITSNGEAKQICSYPGCDIQDEPLTVHTPKRLTTLLQRSLEHYHAHCASRLIYDLRLKDHNAFLSEIHEEETTAKQLEDDEIIGNRNAAKQDVLDALDVPEWRKTFEDVTFNLAGGFNAAYDTPEEYDYFPIEFQIEGIEGTRQGVALGKDADDARRTFVENYPASDRDRINWIRVPPFLPSNPRDWF